jgi:ATP-dependent Clp protease adaptor protein ClpS
MSDSRPDRGKDGGLDILDRPKTTGEEKTKVRPPDMWRAVLLNNDVTPFIVVIVSLVEAFGMNETEATRIMMMAHTNGKAVVVVSTREVIETKCEKGNATASALFRGPDLYRAEKDT